jgi:hypothetical protein
MYFMYRRKLRNPTFVHQNPIGFVGQKTTKTLVFFVEKKHIL